MVKDLLFEELSISSEVDKIGNELTQQIVDKLSKDEGKYQHFIGGITFLSKQVYVVPKNMIFGSIYNIEVYEYIFDDENQALLAYDKIDVGGDFDEKNGTILIHFLSLGKEHNIKMMRSFLYHELKHAYQASLYTTEATSNVLQIATTIISKPYLYLNYVYEFSRLIYFFSKKEMDANMETLYQELIAKDSDDVNILKEYILHLQLYEECQHYIADDNVCNTLYETYGKTFKQLMFYIKHGIQYFENKKRKVLMKYMNYRKRIQNENKTFRRFCFIK